MRNYIFVSTKLAKKGQVQLSWSVLENMELIYSKNWTQGARKVCLKKQNNK